MYKLEFQKVIFKNDNFLSETIGETIKIDKDFILDLERLGSYAKKCNLQILVTSSLRTFGKKVKGAIVKPASHSCHHIGHAIDMNIYYKGIIYDSKKMNKVNYEYLPDEVKYFFDLLVSDNILRWGGYFKTEDTVHIDNDFYHKHKELYQSKLESRILQGI